MQGWMFHSNGMGCYAWRWMILKEGWIQMVAGSIDTNEAQSQKTLSIHDMPPLCFVVAQDGHTTHEYPRYFQTYSIRARPDQIISRLLWRRLPTSIACHVMIACFVLTSGGSWKVSFMVAS
jgi:hypothetical protein